jgi:hypothetical protein
LNQNPCKYEKFGTFELQTVKKCFETRLSLPKYRLSGKALPTGGNGIRLRVGGQTATTSRTPVVVGLFVNAIGGVN